jgi:hypothetical protein
MFDLLVTAIDALSVPVDERALQEVLGLHDRLTAKVTAAIGEADAAGVWDASGATSMRAWLCDQGLAGPDATRLACLAAHVHRLPVLRSAWLAGDLSNGQVRAVAAQLTSRNVALFAEHEAAVVPAVVGLSVSDTIRAMAEWRARADAVLAPDAEPDEPESSLRHSQTLDGRFVTNGAFDAHGGSIVATALGVADSGDLGTAAPERRAEALVSVCAFFLDHHNEATTPRRRPHVSLILGADDLAADGARAWLADFDLRLDPATTSRLLCDCSISRVVADKISGAVSRILDLGRSTDVVSAAQHTALAARDRHCRYPGCDRPASWCDAHHVWWWSRGGPTDLTNLVLLCNRHHHLLHSKRGFEAELLDDGTFVVVDPHGRTRSTRPPGTALAA